jgi:hypothetical protein
MEKINKIKIETIILTLGLIQIFAFAVVLTLFSMPVDGGIGTPNVTVPTNLTVAKVAPELLNVSIDEGAASITLNANSTKTVTCVAVVRDWDNYSDVENVTAILFDAANSTYESIDDNNSHYTNNSCIIDTSYAGDDYLLNATCTFKVYYNANPTSWNCTMEVADNSSQYSNNTDDINVSELLSIGLPDFINYGTVNSTYVSNEQQVNITNLGNVWLDVNLEGYARDISDAFAMNCTRGDVQNISVEYEKYNFTDSNPGNLDLSAFEAVYTNLSEDPTTVQFNLDYQVNEVGNRDAVNSTYWRIYVPLGVSGTCQGNIIFGAVKS